ncbi:unnamed protein product, partial [Rotaria magnacalcarata]
GSGSGPCYVATADVNGDGKCDIIVANAASNNASVLLNVGNGTFLTQTTYLTGSVPTCVAAADVNGDNKLDIIVANSGSNSIGILLNIGNGTFAAQATYSTGPGSVPYCVTAVDVNDNNKTDIIVANFGSNNVGVFLNYC